MRYLSVFTRIIPALLSSAAAVCVLAGCSGIINAHTQKEDMMSDYDVGDNASAKAEIDERLNGVWYKPWKGGVVGSGDELMWRLESGSMNFHEGNFKECIDQLDIAERLIEEYDNRAVLSLTDGAEEMSVLFTNLNALPYRGLCRDRMALSIYKALAYLGAGREDDFRVQLHRLRDQQKKVQEDYSKYFEIDKKIFKAQEEQYPAAAEKYREAVKAPDENAENNSSTEAKRIEDVPGQVVSKKVAKLKFVARAKTVTAAEAAETIPGKAESLIVADAGSEGGNDPSKISGRTLGGTDIDSLGTVEIRTISIEDLGTVTIPGTEIGSDAGDETGSSDAKDKVEGAADTGDETGASEAKDKVEDAADTGDETGAAAADSEDDETDDDDMLDASAFFDPSSNPDFMKGVAEIKEVANRGYGNFMNPAAIFLSGLGSLRDGEYDNAGIDFENLCKAMPNNPMFKRYHATALKLTGREIPGELAGVEPFEFPLDRNCVYVIFANGRSATFRAINVIFPVMTAWPVCEFYDAPFRDLSALSGGKQYDTCILADMDGILAQEYDERLVGVVARIVLSTFIKETSFWAGITAIAISDMPAVPKAFTLVGAIVVGTAYRWVVNTADTRSWEILPKEFQLTQFAMPEDRKVSLKLNGSDSVVKSVSLPEECKSAIIFVDAPSRQNISIHVLPLTTQ